MVNSDLVIETRGLTKRYGTRLAVDDLTLHVRRGEVYGFLGLNGAGKTTTMRMLLALIRPSAGLVRVLGLPPGVPAALRRIGSLVESPTLYPYLSGRDNLRVVARLAGVGEARVAVALDHVSLTARAGDPFHAYSLGMKQRLGVAAALVKDPELLILDEPTNGLDPEGIADMGALVDRLRAEGRTVFLSSHQLAEVEGLADRIGVMRSGRLVAEGALAELRGAPHLLVRAEPLARARQILDAAVPGRVTARAGDLIVDVAPERAAALNQDLVLAGVTVALLRPVERSLTEVFFALNQDADSAPGSARENEGAEAIRTGAAPAHAAEKDM